MGNGSMAYYLVLFAIATNAAATESSVPATESTEAAAKLAREHWNGLYYGRLKNSTKWARISVSSWPQ